MKLKTISLQLLCAVTLFSCYNIYAMNPPRYTLKNESSERITISFSYMGRYGFEGESVIRVSNTISPGNTLYHFLNAWCLIDVDKRSSISIEMSGTHHNWNPTPEQSFASILGISDNQLDMQFYANQEEYESAQGPDGSDS